MTSFLANNKSAAGNGKDKDALKDKFDGVVIKSKAPVSRQPLRTVAGTRQTARMTTATITKVEVLEELRAGTTNKTDDNAMVVDPPASRIPSITTRKAFVSKERLSTTQGRSDAQRRISLRTQRQVDDAESSRVFKKRRTSSESPDDIPAPVEDDQLPNDEELAAAQLAAEIESFANEPEADPETSQWDDLDADDADDPLMVSDYVVEIFDYLKQIEVRL